VLRKSAVESTTLAQPFCINQAVKLGDLPQRLHVQSVVVTHWWVLPTSKTMSVTKMFVVNNQTVIDCLQLSDTETCDEEKMRSKSSTGAKVPWSKSSWTFCSSGASVPRNESSTGAKVLSVDFLLPATKVQRNEKSRYRGDYI